MPDYTIKDLYRRGVDELASEDPEIGSTYEIARGDVIGEMVPPVLRARQRFNELQQNLTAALSDEASMEELEKLDATDLEDIEDEDVQETVGELRSVFDDDLTLIELQNVSNTVACKQALAVLDIEEDITHEDIFPAMAEVVRSHFMKLRPSTNKEQEES